MTVMQEQLVARVKDLSDERASRVMKFIDKLEKNKTIKSDKKGLVARRKAYQKFLKARKKMALLSGNLDYRKELEEAQVERYESLD